MLYQRYRCRSAAKSAGIHHFLTPIGGGEVVVVRPAWTRPPACPDHPAGRVVRNGHYRRKGAGRIKQRYQCSPGCAEHPVPCPAECANQQRCRTHGKKACPATCRAPRHCELLTADADRPFPLRLRLVGQGEGDAADPVTYRSRDRSLAVRCVQIVLPAR